MLFAISGHCCDTGAIPYWYSKRPSVRVLESQRERVLTDDEECISVTEIIQTPPARIRQPPETAAHTKNLLARAGGQECPFPFRLAPLRRHSATALIETRQNHDLKQ